MSFTVTVHRFSDRRLGSGEPITFQSLCHHLPPGFFSSYFLGNTLTFLQFFSFFLFFWRKKIEKNLLQSWVPSSTVTQDTGAKTFESNFIFRTNISRRQWQHTVQRERGKKATVPSQKVTTRGPITSILVPQVCGCSGPTCQLGVETHTHTYRDIHTHRDTQSFQVVVIIVDSWHTHCDRRKHIGQVTSFPKHRGTVVFKEFLKRLTKFKHPLLFRSHRTTCHSTTMMSQCICQWSTRPTKLLS
jgi:hypothetical protein